MTELRIDERYRGTHGIGRYAREVVPRLRPPWQPLGLDGNQYAPLDAFRSLARGSSAEVLVYSPGYAALVRAPRQVLTIHDLIQLRSPWPGRAKFLAYYEGPVRHVVRKAGVVLTVSETSARDIREWLRDDSVRIVNAGNGCSAAFTAEGPAETGPDPHVLFVGNTKKHKNFDVVLRALALAPGIVLRAILPARELSSAQRRAEELGVAGRVHWLSDIDDTRLAALYRGSVATVMPSVLEGFGLPALESIACGTPVLFWRGCEAVGEIVGDRGRALATWGEAEEWAVALRKSAESPRRVEPPLVADAWERTAGIVSDVLERELA